MTGRSAKRHRDHRAPRAPNGSASESLPLEASPRGAGVEPIEDFLGTLDAGGRDGLTQSFGTEVAAWRGELETSHQELHAINEELQSLNRRLSGVNELLADKIAELEDTRGSLRRINEELEHKVAQRTALVRLLQDVAILANSPMPLEQALAATLERVCRNKAWLAGRAYLVFDGEVEDLGICHVRPPLDAGVVCQVFDACEFGSGEWLIADVLATGEPRWSSDVTIDGARSRSEMSALGVRSALAFPATIGERVVAVLEFFSGDQVEPEPQLLEVMRNIGTQIGRVIEREEMRQRIIDLAVEEQRSLGEELHDTLSQQIHGLSMIAQSLAATAPPDQRARALVDGLLDTHRQIRVLASGLVPVHIEAGGLVGALREMAREWERMYGTACSFEGEATAEPRDPRVSTALYRIAREAARNAVIHGQARHIQIRLVAVDARADGAAPASPAIQLEVRDDGCGMDQVPQNGPGMGLQIMRHRCDLVGGTLDIQSQPNLGTTVRCKIPCTSRWGLGGRHGA